MSELTSGTTDLANPPPPATPEAAAARMTVLHQDPAFMQRVEARDPEAFAEHLKLWRIQHGLPAEPQPPQALPDVFGQQNERVLRETETRADMLRADGLGDEQIYQILNGRPQPLEERRWHEQELARLKRDQTWVKRYFEGDREARWQMRLHTAALTLPIARSLDEINSWEAAHNRPLSK